MAKKDDYKELLGEELWYVYLSGRTLRGFVAGIDYNEGITILEVDNPEHKLICLNKKDSYSWGSYEDLFNVITLDIGMGVYSMETNREVFPRNTGYGMSVCAFQ